MLKKRFAEFVTQDFPPKLITAEKENVDTPTSWELRKNQRIDLKKLFFFYKFAFNLDNPDSS